MRSRPTPLVRAAVGQRDEDAQILDLPPTNG